MFLADTFPAALDRLGAMETSRLHAMEELRGGQVKRNAEEKERFWYPTVTLNIDLKTRIPPEGVEWLHARVVTKMLRGSRADLDVVILDPQGELIALSTQVALVVDASRNTKGRAGPEKL
jgi:acyl-CoA thioesterase FadM